MAAHTDVEEVTRKLEAAARAAVRGGGAAVHELGVGCAEVIKVASNRHLLGDDGLVAIQRQSAGGRNPEAAAAPEGTIDPNLRVLGLWGDAGQPLASVSFYTTHPMSYYGDGYVNWVPLPPLFLSSDYLLSCMRWCAGLHRHGSRAARGDAPELRVLRALQRRGRKRCGGEIQ